MELNCKKVPIDVYYLHLEDDKYLNYPYQMIPVKINNFINIFEYSAIFEELKFESASIKKEEQIFSDVRKIIDDKLWKKLESMMM